MTKATTNILAINDLPIGSSPLAVSTNRLSRLMRTSLADLLMSEGQVGLPVWRIYAGLTQFGSATQKQLVKFTDIEQSQISRTLAQLEERGDIVSSRCEVDKRARRFEFTLQGRQRFDELLPVVQRYWQVLNETLSEEEAKLYLDMSERLAEAAQMTVLTKT